MRRKLVAIAAASALAVSTFSLPAQATYYPPKPPVVVHGGGGGIPLGLGLFFGCVAGVVFTAMYVNWKYNAELDGPGFCGFGARPAQPKSNVVKARG